jgi:hypothetical protein
MILLVITIKECVKHFDCLLFHSHNEKHVRFWINKKNYTEQNEKEWKRVHSHLMNEMKQNNLDRHDRPGYVYTHFYKKRVSENEHQ